MRVAPRRIALLSCTDAAYPDARLGLITHSACSHAAATCAAIEGATAIRAVSPVPSTPYATQRHTCMPNPGRARAGRPHIIRSRMQPNAARQSCPASPEPACAARAPKHRLAPRPRGRPALRAPQTENYDTIVCIEEVLDNAAAATVRGSSPQINVNFYESYVDKAEPNSVPEPTLVFEDNGVRRATQRTHARVACLHVQRLGSATPCRHVCLVRCARACRRATSSPRVAFGHGSHVPGCWPNSHARVGHVRVQTSCRAAVGSMP